MYSRVEEVIVLGDSDVDEWPGEFSCLQCETFDQLGHDACLHRERTRRFAVKGSAVNPVKAGVDRAGSALPLLKKRGDPASRIYSDTAKSAAVGHLNCGDAHGFTAFNVQWRQHLVERSTEEGIAVGDECLFESSLDHGEAGGTTRAEQFALDHGIDLEIASPWLRDCMRNLFGTVSKCKHKARDAAV